MGRLDSLKGKIEDWGTKDSKRLTGLRLDAEFRNEGKTMKEHKVPDWVTKSLVPKKGTGCVEL